MIDFGSFGVGFDTLDTSKFSGSEERIIHIIHVLISLEGKWGYDLYMIKFFFSFLLYCII